jgi:hypothetical protein
MNTSNSPDDRLLRLGSDTKGYFVCSLFKARYGGPVCRTEDLENTFQPRRGGLLIISAFSEERNGPAPAAVR